MKAVVSWWSLDKSEQTIVSLRQALQVEGVTPWEEVEGLRLKFWISDFTNNLWGAVTIWESDAAMKQLLPPNRAAELIGYPAAFRFSFDIEASAGEKAILELFNKR